MTAPVLRITVRGGLPGKSQPVPIELGEDGSTVKNNGPNTIYYRDEQPVGSGGIGGAGPNDGSIASGASTTLYGQQFFVVDQAQNSSPLDSASLVVTAVPPATASSSPLVTAWAASTAVIIGQARSAPDGSLILSNDTRTTGASYDVTEATHWTIIGVDTSDIETSIQGFSDSITDLGTRLSSAASRSGNRVYFVGDSITAYGLANTASNIALPNGTDLSPLLCARSWAAYGSMLSEGKMVYAGQAAGGGNTITQIVANHIPTAIAAAPAVCVVLAGRNDVVNLGAGASQGTIDTAFLAAISADTGLKKGFQLLRDSNIVPCLCTLSATTGNDSGQKQLTNRINAWLRQYAYANALPLCDMASATTDPTTNEAFSSYTFDASHPKPIMCRLMGAELNTKLAPALRPFKPMFAYATTDPADKGNLMPNPLMATDTNTDGLSDNWTDIGTATKTFTRPTVDAAGLGNFQQIARTGGSGSALIYSDRIAVTGGDRLAFSFRFKTTNVETSSTQVAVRLIGLLNTGDVVTSPVQYIAGITTFFGDQPTPGLFYQEGTVQASGVGFVCVVASLAGGTTATLAFGQVGVFNLTSMGALNLT